MAKRVRQNASLTKDAWNARSQIIRGEHRAEAARTKLAQAWKQRLMSKGGGAAAHQQLLHQLRVRRWRRQMETFNTKRNRNSERDLGRLGLPARTGPEARLLGAGGPARHLEAVSAAFTAAVEWRLMIEANTCTTQWQIGVGNGKLERICKKLDQISQK